MCRGGGGGAPCAGAAHGRGMQRRQNPQCARGLQFCGVEAPAPFESASGPNGAMSESSDMQRRDLLSLSVSIGVVVKRRDVRVITPCRSMIFCFPIL